MVGLVGLGLGLGLVLAPRAIARALGRPEHDVGKIRLAGVAQMLAGLGVLVTRRAWVRKSVIIEVGPDDVYAFWRRLEHLPLIFPHLAGVQRLDAVRSRWTAVGPRGRPMRWEAELVDDQLGRMVSWTTNGGWLSSDGVVRFRPLAGGQCTEVEVEMAYGVRGGWFGRAAAAAFGLSPEAELEGGLRRLAELFDLGEAGALI